MGRVATDPLVRYRDKIAVGAPDECWPWTAARFRQGYGAFRLGDKQWKAHRFGYTTLIGPIPDGMLVCHTCDNPPCQNPEHWFLGTPAANNADRNAKNRQAQGPAHARRAVKKLTDEAVLAIRDAYREGARQTALAEWFGVSQTTVSQVVRQTSWGQIVDDGLGSLASRSKYAHRLTVDDYTAVKAAYATGLSQEAVARQFGISQPMVSRIVRGGLVS